MAQLLQLPNNSDTAKQLYLENELLRIENSHLRQLLQLATCSYHDAIKQQASEEIHHSCHASADSSLLLTTPPRSPPLEQGNSNRLAAKRSQTSRLQREPSIGSQECRVQAPTIVLRDIDDIADVGPPLSPPPVSNMRAVGASHSSSTHIIDPCDASDNEEASVGSYEIDHDLAQ